MEAIWASFLQDFLVAVIWDNFSCVLFLAWVVYYCLLKKRRSLLSCLDTKTETILSFSGAPAFHSFSQSQCGVTKLCIGIGCTLGFVRVWLSHFRWDSQQGRPRTTSILVWSFWNFKLKVLKYPRNCRLHSTLILNV